VFVTAQTVPMFGTFLVSYAIAWHLTLAILLGVVP
jgi:hypothetical protein